MKPTLALIDGDTIPFIAAWKTNDPDKIKEELDNIIRDILQKADAQYYLMFLTENRSSRKYAIATTRPYKGTRRDSEVPMLVPLCKEYLREVWFAFSHPEYEADDILSIHYYHYREAYSVVVCANDKDYFQLPGLHQVPNKPLRHITDDEAQMNLLRWMLIGDSSDNIAGVPKVGPVGADKLLAGKTKTEQLHAILQAYIDAYGEERGWLKFSECALLLELPITGNIPILDPLPYNPGVEI